MEPESKKEKPEKEPEQEPNEPNEESNEQNENIEAEKVYDTSGGLEKALLDERARSQANMDGWKRCQADFVNYKRFAEQDKQDTLKYANINLLSSILPMIDDFERGLSAIPPEAEKEKWVEGLKHIDRKFKDTLHKLGITHIKAVGLEFDPHVMDAISTAKGKKDIVIHEVEKGYKLWDKVIRPAKVIVGDGEEKVKEEE